MEEIETERLLIRRPRAEDVPAIFARYASDPEVTRYVGFPTHHSLAQTEGFITYSDDQWARFPIGPQIVFARDTGQLLGGAGLIFRDGVGIAGYIFARDAWGRGYATESLQAAVACGRALRLPRLEAEVHIANAASCRVLEKGGFVRYGIRPGGPNDFPNLPPDAARDAFRYGLNL